MTASQLVPVVPGTIGNVHCLTVDGRTLHGVLGVRRDFSNWIKGRISKYGFVQGQDFEFFSNSGKNSELDSPNLANQKKHGGDRRSLEYRCTLDMGKELCMVENNEKGRIARRYFIECERRLLSGETAPHSLSTTSSRKPLRALVHAWAQISGTPHTALWPQVKAHFQLSRIDDLPESWIPDALEWVQAKIDQCGRALSPSTPSTDKESLTVARAIEPAPEQALAATTLDAKTYASGKEFFDDVSKLRRNAEGIREALHLFARPCGRSAYLPHEKQVLYDNANEAANVAVTSLNQAIYALRMIYNIRAHVSFSR